MTDSDIILNRVDGSLQYGYVHTEAARRHMNMYLGLPEDSVGPGPHPRAREVVAGEVNWPAINLRTKIAGAVSTGPSWNLAGLPDEVKSIVQSRLSDYCREEEWVYAMHKALLYQGIGAIGYIAYSWSNGRFRIDPVGWGRIVLDPDMDDMDWLHPAFMGRIVSMSRAAAAARYGDVINERISGDSRNDPSGIVTVGDVAGVNSVPMTGERPELQRGVTDRVNIVMYYDEDTEAEILWSGDTGADLDGGPRKGHGRILAIRKNPYGKIPIIVLRMDPDPEFAVSNGDFDYISGAWKMQRTLMDMVAAQAKNGGGVAWIDGAAISPEDAAAYMNGTLMKPILLTGIPGEKAVGFTANMAVNENVLQSMAMMSQGVDSAMSVTQYDRGVPTGTHKSATEAQLLASRSTARGKLYVAMVENAFRKIGAAWVDCNRKWSKDGDLTMALRQVTGVSVAPGSTVFNSPEMERAEASQLLQSLLPMQAALTAEGRPIDIEFFANHLMRAYGITDTTQAYMNADKVKLLEQAAQQQAQAQAGGGQQPKSLAETLNIQFKDFPPDVQRQVEERLGFVPSQMPAQTAQTHDMQKLAVQGGIELQKTQLSHEHSIQQAQMEAAHSAAESHAERMHEAGMSAADRMHDAQMDVNDKAHEAGMAEFNNEHAVKVASLKNRGKK